jgi:FkbM family methyltransferase
LIAANPTITEIEKMCRQPPETTTAVPLSSPNLDDIGNALIEAIGLQHAGQDVEAEKRYRTIIDSPAGHAVASYGFGMLCAAQGRQQEAIDAYRHAIVLRPGFVDAYINLGTVFLALGQPRESEALYRQAIALSPGNAMAHGNLGKALQDLGRIDEAIAEYRAAIAREPDNAIVHLNFGAALLEQRAWNDSETVTRRAIALQPENAMAHANLGAALMHLGRHADALATCHKAIALQPRGVAIHASLGGAMLEMGALPEAASLCRHAIALDPSLADAHFNLSHALKAMNQLGDAENAARQAIVMSSDSAEYHFHLAHILLLRGDLTAGWLEYEWRWKLPDFAWIGNLHGAFSQPLWAGEDISGKTILIYTEQGLGDIILFARYLPLVTRKAGRVIVAVHPPMRRLLGTIEGITIVSIGDVPLPDFDVHCPLLSLARAFATRLDSIPAEVPYLHADPVERVRWDRRIGGIAPRVGIVWAGNPATKRDHFRSPGLISVMPLFSVPGIDFIALQVGPERIDRDASALPLHVLDLGGEIADLADTAAIMSGLDLMISSCTAPLHLAGALGVPTWAMIPAAPYFPWLLERTDTPWYPSMRLYRQEQPGRDWSTVVGRMTVDLAAMVQSRKNRSPQPSAIPREPQAMPMHAGPVSYNVNNFTVIDSVYGKFVVNRHCSYQAEAMIKTGYPHIEPELAKILSIVRSLSEGSVVVDAGANIGLVSIPVAREIKARGGIVHAFEVQRMMFYALCGSAALNDLSNLYVHNMALGASDGKVSAGQPDYGLPQDFGLYSLTNPIESTSREDIMVAAIDDLDLPRLDFLKIDVEGMEPEVLRGARDAIRDFAPWCWVEYWRVDINEIKANFKGEDYRFFPMDRLNLLCAPAARLASSGISIDACEI